MNAEQAKEKMHKIVGDAAKEALRLRGLSDFLCGWHCATLHATRMDAEFESVEKLNELSNLADRLSAEIHDMRKENFEAAA